MIVIATHDRIDLLNNLLTQLHDIELNGHTILVVDTNSTDSYFLENIEKTKKQFPKVLFDRKEYDCWDSGAYIHAYMNYVEDRYIFLQDSIEITNPNIILDWDSLLDVNDVVPMYNHKFRYDTISQKEWISEFIEYKNEPNDLIFGPIFGVNKTLLDNIPKYWLKTPSNKEQACGMERRWSLMFHCLGAKTEYMVYISVDDEGEFFRNPTKYTKWTKYIKKIFLHR